MTSDNPARSVAPSIAAALLAWYDRHRRRLPWRARPGETPDPYRVWLSEVMLQQTTVVAAKRYFAAFLERWPTVEALAAASLDEVLTQWAGLGYYARARNLHACARKVAGLGGSFPETEKELLALPGIGPYTAAAIAAIAFGRRAAAIDGNAERVIARFAAIRTPLPAARHAIRDTALRLVPADRPGDFVQALMDLGATICTPRKPACGICPWSDPCKARRRGMAEELPVGPRRPKPPVRRGTVFWVERRDRAILVRKRPENGLLGGMLEVPSTDWTATGPIDIPAAAPVQAGWSALPAQVEHTFTHFHLVLDIWRAETVGDAPELTAGGYGWMMPGDLNRAALPSLMRKVVAAVLGPDALRPRRD